MSHIRSADTPDDAASSEPAERQLTAFDRCDACGAQAYVRVEINGSELFFCAHHAKEHHAKLSAIATSWHDESDRLLDGQKA
jgi:hypothetical protein